MIGEELDNNERFRIAYTNDLIIGFLFLILGIIIFLFGFGMSESISLSFSMFMMFSGGSIGLANSVWFWAPGWAISISGLAALFYGLQKAVNGILKIMILKNVR